MAEVAVPFVLGPICRGSLDSTCGDGRLKETITLMLRGVQGIT
jgi:hypothetical protein